MPLDCARASGALESGTGPCFALAQQAETAAFRLTWGSQGMPRLGRKWCGVGTGGPSGIADARAGSPTRGRDAGFTELG